MEKPGRRGYMVQGEDPGGSIPNGKGAQSRNRRDNRVLDRLLGFSSISSPDGHNMMVIAECCRSRLSIYVFRAVALLILLSSTRGIPAGSSDPGAISTGLKTAIEMLEASGTERSQPDPFYFPHRLVEFYVRRQFTPAWIGPSGSTRRVTELVEILNAAGHEGLAPGDYHITTIGKELRTIRETPGSESVQVFVLLELYASDAFFAYVAHLLNGRVDPIAVQTESRKSTVTIDLAATLEAGLRSGSIARMIRALAPDHPGYRRLRKALADYRNIYRKGGWAKISPGPQLRKGDRDRRVMVLRERLEIEYPDCGDQRAGSGSFDDGLKRCVEAFQRRHGLDVDGIVGLKTLGELNTPVEDRIRQIEINMERWRWLPSYLGKRYVLVNIADFELNVFEMDRQVMVMRAVVGKDYRQTPVFSAPMTFFVINPYWYVPRRVALEGLLPAIRNDPNYILSHGLKIYRESEGSEEEIDPESIEWESVAEENLDFFFRQSPGPLNALGRFKFMFPNPFDIYIHDTPSQALFKHNMRTFSAGCIRIERPLELAEYLLKGSSRWNGRTLLAAADSGKTRTISLPEAIPVHIQYWTAWADPAGRVHFRPDVYGRDRRLEEVILRKRAILQ